MGNTNTCIFQRLQDHGVIYLKGVRSGDKTEKLFAVYDDVVLEEIPDNSNALSDFAKGYSYLKEEDLPKALQEAALMAKPNKVRENFGGKILKDSQIRKYRGEIKKKGGTLILEEDILLNKKGKITNKAVVKNFKPVILSGIKFDNLNDLFYFMRNEGFAGLFDHHSKQLILTKDPTEYLLFHEMAHFKHFEEIGDAYLLLKPWQRETYVFEEIWKQKHLWTKKEAQHALDYVNQERGIAGQSLITKKI